MTNSECTVIYVYIGIFLYSKPIKNDNVYVNFGIESIVFDNIYKRTISTIAPAMDHQHCFLWTIEMGFFDIRGVIGENYYRGIFVLDIVKVGWKFTGFDFTRWFWKKKKENIEYKIIIYFYSLQVRNFANVCDQKFHCSIYPFTKPVHFPTRTLVKLFKRNSVIIIFIQYNWWNKNIDKYPTTAQNLLNFS